MKMSEGLSTCKDRVEKILSEHPTTRDSDKLLWLAYLCTYHNLIDVLGYKEYLKFKDLIMHSRTPTMESIRRVRQKLQENGQYEGKGRKVRLTEAEIIKAMING